MQLHSQPTSGTVSVTNTEEAISESAKHTAVPSTTTEDTGERSQFPGSMISAVALPADTDATDQLEVSSKPTFLHPRSPRSRHASKGRTSMNLFERMVAKAKESKCEKGRLDPLSLSPRTQRRVFMQTATLPNDGAPVASPKPAKRFTLNIPGSESSQSHYGTPSTSTPHHLDRPRCSTLPASGMLKPKSGSMSQLRVPAPMNRPRSRSLPLNTIREL